MNTFPPQHVLAIAIGISVVSLIVAIAALLYATSLHSSTPHFQQSEVSQPHAPTLVEFTPDHPASAYLYFEDLISGSGSVVEIDKHSITVFNRLDGEVVFSLTPSTKIYLQGNSKDPEEHNEEMRRFRAAINELIDPGGIFIPPPPFELVPAQISDISRGTGIDIFSEGKEAREIHIHSTNQ